MNFYLLYGNDKAVLDKELNDIKKKLIIGDNDIIYYDIDSVNDIVEEALTFSMFSSNKLIIIDSTSYLSDKKDIKNIDVLEKYFDNFNINSYLVFISNSSSVDSRKKLVKLISGKGEVKKAEATFDYLKKYVSDYVSLNGYKINNNTLSLFLDRCGNNLNNITNELDKLMLYKIDDKVINSADILKLVEENIDDSIYDLVSSILKNDKCKAIALYNKFTESGIDVCQMIAVIASQIRLLFQVKHLYNKGKTNDEIAKILEFKSVYRVKYLLSDSYYYTEKDLLKYLSHLANMDKDIKAGNISGDIYMQLFIAEKDM